MLYVIYVFPLFQLSYTVRKVAYLKKYFIFSNGNKSLDRQLRCSELLQLMTGTLHTQHGDFESCPIEISSTRDAIVAQTGNGCQTIHKLGKVKPKQCNDLRSVICNGELGIIFTKESIA